MRITFVLPGGGLSGGVRVVAGYAQRLQEAGHEVTLLIWKKPLAVRTKIKNAVLRRSTAAQAPSHLKGVEVRQRIVPGWSEARAADAPDADAIVATWWETAPWVASLPSSKGAKAYFIQHDEQTAYEDDKKVMRPLVTATWQLPLHKILIAHWLVQLARERCGDEPVSYVPNAVDLQQFHAPWRGKQPRPTIGLMYSSTRFKGVDISLKAFELARRQVPELELMAFGAEEPDAKLPLPRRTQYIRQPAQDQIRAVYASCDAWLFGSRSEGFGLPILEAMACRTPVIGTATGAAPELLADGAGILVKPENPAEMAQAIVRIAQMSPAKWQAMSAAAYSKATCYTWDDATRQFEAALRVAMDRTARGVAVAPVDP